jgi:hypothetical protein
MDNCNRVEALPLLGIEGRSGDREQLIKAQ